MATVPQLASLFDSTIKACVQQVNSAISGSTIVDESSRAPYWMSRYFPHTFNVAYSEFDTLFLLLYTLAASYSYCLLGESQLIGMYIKIAWDQDGTAQEKCYLTCSYVVLFSMHAWRVELIEWWHTHSSSRWMCVYDQ